MKRFSVQRITCFGDWVFVAAFDAVIDAVGFQYVADGITRIWDNNNQEEVISY